jgi:hypothetical protein
VPVVQTRETIEHLTVLSYEPSCTISEVLSMFTNFYTTTESFIGATADFKVLTMGEKSSLLQRNIHGVLNICATFLLRMSGMFDSTMHEYLILSIYGWDVYQATKRIGLQIDDDLVFIKFMLVILAFSSNCYMVEPGTDQFETDSLLHGTCRIWGSQNIYVEIFWKYLLYRYNYFDAAARFARMIKHTLDLLMMSADTQKHNNLHHQFIDEITIATEQTLAISEIVEIPLWGDASP